MDLSEQLGTRNGWPMWWLSQRKGTNGEYVWITRISIAAYPKDSFPLPRIDHIMDSSAGHGMLSFLDAFSGYHQIPMHPSDTEKTFFITPHGLYCYNVMPFGLKNVGATYQRLVAKMFRPLLGSTMEVYIDDMLVKSKQRPDNNAHLQ